MPDAPLSRRARRAMGAEAAERAAAQNGPTRSFAEGIATGETPAVDTGGQPFSRRDRRRIERLARPMESWTAEEEMIATGQIPAMTPERIAEQERLAREAAERAAADAQTASSELRILAQRDLERGRPGESANPPARVPTTDVPVVQPAPRADPDAPLEERAIVEPYSPRFELGEDGQPSVGDESKSVEIPTGFDPNAKIERTPAPTSAEAQADAVQEGDSAAAAREAEAAAARAKVFAELFPPGSSQASLLEQDRLAREAGASQREAGGPQREAGAPESAAAGQPEPDDDEAERQRGIEEIRRLTEAAISSLESKAQSQPEPAETESANRYDMPAAQEGEHGFAVAGAPASRPEPERPPAEPFPNLGALAPPSGQFPTTPAYQQQAPTAPSTPSSGTAPHHATFDEMLRTPPTESQAPHVGQPDPQHGQGPSAWGTHPQDAGQTPPRANANDFQPLADSPQQESPPPSGQFPTTSGQFPTSGQQQAPSGQFPTASGQFPTSGQQQAPSGQFPTTSGQFPTSGQQQAPSGQFPTASGQFPTTSGQFPTSGQQQAPSGQFPTTSGQFPVTGQIRRAPELPPVGGAKHFKWLHLAVIGALMFLLGVVIYNVAFGQ
ncbi:hypothetical protein [Demequina sp.]|uniref:hypothetical protein n=1 Tax=Demequina sp. TaxID=2050685 RepID=UPI0025C1E1FF|nr:hypothetical protein [Demequina sp.]